jgi:hypothetical protein
VSRCHWSCATGALVLDGCAIWPDISSQGFVGRTVLLDESRYHCSCATGTLVGASYLTLCGIDGAAFQSVDMENKRSAYLVGPLSL